MKKLWHLFSLILLTSIAAYGQADAFYTVQVGTFIDAKPEDFTGLREVGFVHAAELGSNLVEVYVGGFDNREAAEAMADQARQKGYANAFVQERPIDPNTPAAIIQFATRQVDRPIQWENLAAAGPLFGILNGNLIKVATGPFTSEEAAKRALPAIRGLGYRDAFVKTVSSSSLLPLTSFETGVKKPLIPIAMEEETTAKSVDERPQGYGSTTGGRLPNGNEPQPTGMLRPASAEAYLEATPEPQETVVPNIPSTYDYAAGKSVPQTGFAAEAAMDLPAIDGSVKRTSVLELQKILKSAKAYTGSLDGYYGPGTAAGYEKYVAGSRTLQRYQVLAEYAPLPGQEGAAGQLQEAVNEMGYNTAAAARLDQFADDPLAKAYQAYQLFLNFGPGQEVNQLLNTAIQGAFNGKRLSGLPFDPTSTYAYQDMGQVILHLHYVHAAPATEEAAPCWLMARHPQETGAAYEALAPQVGKALRLEGCGQFDSWPEARVLVSIAADLNDTQAFNASRLQQAATERARLYLAPQALNEEEQKGVEKWHQNLINGLNSWSVRDPLNERLSAAFKAMYFQTQVRLEDYFMDKGFDRKKAQGLALATLHTLVAYHMERFV
ncbi:SPOR domain-containing protein [Phaeodactylibacter luteus]|uniref:SPOR domain-containing protein n=1 Tax=Phaeodactylibacter luteus TaxID=1564516 RepID=A0A5C6RI00_9BACT|nr:SPOR domain-containing protein [Phaeodactylibacter luteus]TXB61674.1 SPOR domain-containing protein [Phaeodactylibacter luteus]